MLELNQDDEDEEEEENVEENYDANGDGGNQQLINPYSDDYDPEEYELHNYPDLDDDYSLDRTIPVPDDVASPEGALQLRRILARGLAPPDYASGSREAKRCDFISPEDEDSDYAEMGTLDSSGSEYPERQKELIPNPFHAVDDSEPRHSVYDNLDT